jgi:hypothetical protein
MTLSDAQGNQISGIPTDNLGNFIFTNVPEGAYTITGNSCEYSFTPLLVTVAGADVAGLLVTATAVPNYSVSGMVTSNAVGVPDVRIMMQNTDGSQFGATTQADGSYSLKCLQPGTYTVSPSNFPWGTQYSFSPPSVELVLTELNPSATQDFAATPL